MPTHTPSQLAAIERSASLETALRRAPQDFRVLSGDRPTGPLHIGHYLANRVRLQNLGVTVMVLIADYQLLTDRSGSPQLPAVVRGLIADYLAVGIDPGRSTIFSHSAIPSLNELVCRS
jgi:tryptophanyl-tRNA synthetase